jgi:hypothetical protein
VNVPTDHAFLTLVCARLGQTAVNLGVPGSSAQNTNLADVAAAPRDAATQVSLVWWGLNDLGSFGPSLDGYKASMRYLLSRLRSRSSDIHTFADRAFSYRGGPWQTQKGQRVATGDATAIWKSPRGFPGGVVAFTFLFTRGPSATYTFSVDGRRAGSFDIGSLTPPPPANSAVTGGAWRVRVPRGPGHVVRIALTHVVSAASIAGWELESPHPPLIVLMGQYRLSTYEAYRGQSPFVPTDAGVAALNDATLALAREYGSYVAPVDLDRLMGKRPDLLMADRLHPTASAQKIIAAAVEKAIARNRHVRDFTG